MRPMPPERRSGLGVGDGRRSRRDSRFVTAPSADPVDVRDRPDRDDLRDAGGALPGARRHAVRPRPGRRRPAVRGARRSAPSCGALSGGWVRHVRRQGEAVIWAVAAWGAAIAAFGLVGSHLWWALGFLAIAGAADVVSAIFRSTITQVNTPDRLRGRLSAIFILVVTGGPRLGDFEAGLVATLVHADRLASSRAGSRASWAPGSWRSPSRSCVRTARPPEWRRVARQARPEYASPHDDAERRRVARGPHPRSHGPVCRRRHAHRVRRRDR